MPESDFCTGRANFLRKTVAAVQEGTSIYATDEMRGNNYRLFNLSYLLPLPCLISYMIYEYPMTLVVMQAGDLP